MRHHDKTLQIALFLSSVFPWFGRFFGQIENMLNNIWIVQLVTSDELAHQSSVPLAKNLFGQGFHYDESLPILIVLFLISSRKKHKMCTWQLLHKTDCSSKKWDQYKQRSLPSPV